MKTTTAAEAEQRLSGMIADTPHENALRILPGLQYLSREAQGAGLEDVAGVLDGAIDDIIDWMRASAH
ncbi:MAG: hypothetical protein ACE363_08250 [Alphaproteobacteria bacterium]